ncbi:MAG TPA: archaellin/type IV pilin N-terminal domain-containing protein [Terriglobales bacterium]|nr:archaellin/type IV pilin N-terminal domain-containing protein [Terriglobales bacterium]
MKRLLCILPRLARNRKAISGLETAIVLIAFVIVASAFAYATLNMGFLATQKSQQVVLGGLQAAASALTVDGPRLRI